MHAAIVRYLSEQRPASVLECSHQPFPELSHLCKTEGISLTTVPTENVLQDRGQPADLAVVHHCLEDLSMSQGQQLLGRLRNSLAPVIWVIVPPKSAWTLPAFVALGFKMDQPQPFEGELVSYTYDIRSYNHKREWNNSRFWANPENFDKFRW